MIDGNVESTLDKLKGKVQILNVPLVDVTLTKEGQCADAKATGDAIKVINTNLDHLKNYVTPEMFGAVGDGLEDDTDAIINCVNSNKPIIAKGKYKISKTIMIEAKKTFIMCGGGTFTMESKNESSVPLFYFNVVENMEINNIHFESERNNVKVYPPNGHTRPKNSLSSNIVFLKLMLVENAIISNVSFKNSEFDINIYNCGDVKIKNFTSENASMFSYASENKNVLFENGEVELYELVGAGDHHFYICYGNDDVVIKNVKIFSCENSGTMPIHVFCSGEQASTYGKTKNILVENCEIEYYKGALSVVVEESATFNNCHFFARKVVEDLLYTGTVSCKEIIFNNCTFGGDGKTGFMSSIANVALTFKNCDFRAIYSTNCANNCVINFFDCRIEKGMDLSDSSFAIFNLYNCIIKNTNDYYAIISSKPNETLNLYNCELLANYGDGILGIRNNNSIVKMFNCFGNNTGNYNMFEYSSTFTPIIYVYNCIFPNTSIRDSERIKGANNIFKNFNDNA